MSGARLCKLCRASLAERPPQTRYCDECRKIRDREIVRGSAKRHPDRIRDRFRKWAKKNAAHLAEYRSKRAADGLTNRDAARKRGLRYYYAHRDKAQAYYRENADAVKRRSAKRYAENREPELARAAARYASNPEPAKARTKAWRAANYERFLEQCNAAWHKRRARLRANGGNGVTRAEWAEILVCHGHQCAYCGRSGKMSRDHVVPLARGGLDEPANVVPACRPCNASKGTKPLSEWLKYKNDRHTSSAAEGVVETD